MQVAVEGRKLVFLEYTVQEFNRLTRLLTWEDKFAKQLGKTVTQTLLFEEGGKYFTFSGLAHILKEEFKNFEIIRSDQDGDIDNLEVRPDILEGVTLRDYQVLAIKKSVNLRRGILEISTGGGKSEVILGIYRVLSNNKLIKKVLIITPSVPICKQFKSRALIRGFKESDVGLVYGQEKDFNKPVTIAVINTLAQGINKGDRRIMDLIEGADLICIDEAHHTKADSFLSVAFASNSKYLIGLSGTPFKDRSSILEDIGDSIIHGLIGRVILKVPQRILVDKGYIADTAIYMKGIKGSFKKYKSQYNVIYKREIVENKSRNQSIVDYCDIFNEQGLTVLVSVNVKNHAINLLKDLRKRYPSLSCICIFGGSESASFDSEGELIQHKIDQEMFMRDFESGVYNVIIATQVWDEGVDIPTVGALILAGGGKSLRQVRQRLGRGVRSKKTGKNVVFILDFIDRGHIWMFQQSKKRLSIYLDEVESDVIEIEDDFLDLIESCNNH